jgi:DNA-binding NarL/FixJ family response regulator
MGEQLTEQRVMRVLIVDDDPLFRLGVAAALAGDEQLEFILSEAGDGEAALALVASEEPAVVVPDEHHALAASEGWDPSARGASRCRGSVPLRVERVAGRSTQGPMDAALQAGGLI